MNVKDWNKFWEEKYKKIDEGYMNNDLNIMDLYEFSKFAGLTQDEIDKYELYLGMYNEALDNLKEVESDRYVKSELKELDELLVVYENKVREFKDKHPLIYEIERYTLNDIAEEIKSLD